MRFRLILFCVFLFLSNTLKGQEEVVIKARAILSRFSVATMPYCSGYHCYHQSMDTCERIGGAQCRVLEIGNLNKVVSGHGNIVLRIPYGSKDYFCMADPQKSSQRINLDFCWSFEATINPPNSYWIPPNLIQERYCRIRKLGCNKFGLTLFRVRTSSELEGEPYEAWWKNTTQSAGQIFKLCEHKNSPKNRGPLPASMPSCVSSLDRKCSSVGQSFACNHGGRCQVLHCNESSKWIWSSYENLPLPSCSKEGLINYCARWNLGIRKSAEARIIDGYIYNNTQHFCRTSKGMTKFWCHPSGPIFSGRGLRNEL